MGQINEIENEDFVIIGHHSHSHEYLINKSNDFIKDMETANKNFIENLGYIPNLFSYPFGEYSEYMRKCIEKFYFCLWSTFRGD